MPDHNERFGRALELEDASGNVVEHAFAALSSLHFDAEEGVIRIGMRAWRDAAAYDAGKAPLKLAPDGDVKTYYLNGERYRQAIAMEFEGPPSGRDHHQPRLAACAVNQGRGGGATIGGALGGRVPLILRSRGG